MPASRKALVVGLDHYPSAGDLHGCVKDATSVEALLARNGDSTVNFDTNLGTGTAAGGPVSRGVLKDAVRQVFADKVEVALFYFAGHGHIEATGGYLCGTDCKTGDDGLPLSEIMAYANASNARNRIVILDSCHSGALGDHAVNGAVAEVAEGVTILTASTKDQYAEENGGSGVFTDLLVDALKGAAANLVGDITPGSIYAHIDQSLGRWGQRPVFKTNVETFVSIRSVKPPLELADLQRIAEFFPTPGFDFPLDPGYEPESGSPDPDKTSIFAILQRYSRVGLLVPVGTTHPYHAAMESRSVRLTQLGEHYRRLAAKKLI